MGNIINNNNNKYCSICDTVDVWPTAVHEYACSTTKEKVERNINIIYLIFNTIQTNNNKYEN